MPCSSRYCRAHSQLCIIRPGSLRSEEHRNASRTRRKIIGRSPLMLGGPQSSLAVLQGGVKSLHCLSPSCRLSYE